MQFFIAVVQLLCEMVCRASMNKDVYIYLRDRTRETQSNRQESSKQARLVSNKQIITNTNILIVTRLGQSLE